jgi:coproporphyrinogen III oxidase-like Fe-S oxidoreductase
VGVLKIAKSLGVGTGAIQTIEKEIRAANRHNTDHLPKKFAGGKVYLSPFSFLQNRI